MSTLQYDTTHDPTKCSQCDLLYITYRCKEDKKIRHVAQHREKGTPQKIVYCQWTYGERFKQTLRCVSEARLYVDAVVLVHDGSFTRKQMDRLTKCKYTNVQNVHLFYKPFKDNFPDQRNEYLKRAKEVMGNKEFWVLVSDPDELFNVTFLKDLRIIVDKSNGGWAYNLCRINSRDVMVKGKNKTENKSTFYKDLFFKHYPEVKYVGVGVIKNVHETMTAPNYGWHTVQLPDKYYYHHIKSHEEICERATRNFWIGGGGDNEATKDWKELRELADSCGWPKDWTYVRKLFRKGRIPKPIKEWIIKHRNDNARPNVDVEKRDMFTWYSTYLHPKENTGKWVIKIKSPKKDSVGEVEKQVQDGYKKILGREADGPGLKNYVMLIKSGELSREKFLSALLNSDEYKSKTRWKA